jgi:hypothetical protein
MRLATARVDARHIAVPSPPHNRHVSGGQNPERSLSRKVHRPCFRGQHCARREAVHWGRYKKKEHCMRKTFIIVSAISAISAIALAAPASAQQRQRQQVVVTPAPGTAHPAATTTGVAAGTVFGVGLTQGWWGTTGAAAAFPTSAAGAAAAGGVAGVGAIAMFDAATQPCRGFRAFFSPFVQTAPGQSGCANGEFVGYRVAERPARRVIR